MTPLERSAMILILDANGGEELSDRQAGIVDALETARAIVADLENAESCETSGDFLANIVNAREQLSELARALRELCKP